MRDRLGQSLMALSGELSLRHCGQVARRCHEIAECLCAPDLGFVTPELTGERVEAGPELERRLSGRPCSRSRRARRIEVVAHVRGSLAAQNPGKLLLWPEHLAPGRTCARPRREVVRILPVAVNDVVTGPVADSNGLRLRRGDVSHVRVRARDAVAVNGAVDHQERRVDQLAALGLVSAAALEPLPRGGVVFEARRTNHGDAGNRDLFGRGLARLGALRPPRPPGGARSCAQRPEDDDVELVTAAAGQVAAVGWPEQKAEVELAEPEELLSVYLVRSGASGAVGNRAGRCRRRFRIAQSMRELRLCRNRDVFPAASGSAGSTEVGTRRRPGVSRPPEGS